MKTRHIEEKDYSQAYSDKAPVFKVIVSEQRDRELNIDGKWYIDFGSLNYLGLDIEKEIVRAANSANKRWGVHPGWSRLFASQSLFIDFEQKIAEYVKCQDTLLFASLGFLHAGIIPALTNGIAKHPVGKGVLLLDKHAHATMQNASQLAAANGARADWFRHNDIEDLESKLKQYEKYEPKIIVVDGVYSMSGDFAPLPELAACAKRFDARIYVDDAHGLGIIGENPTPENPYGERGNGIVRYYGMDYKKDKVIYTATMNKAFSAFVAFVSCGSMSERKLFQSAYPWVYSTPSATASIAIALKALEMVDRQKNDKWRRKLYNLTKMLVDGSRELGFEVSNTHYHPIVSIVIGYPDDTVKQSVKMWNDGMLISTALYPMVPRNRCSLRFTITSANTEDQIERALKTLKKIRPSVKY